MSLALYLAAALFLFASHAVLSAPRVRPALIARLGRPAFLALYSLVSLVALAAFVLAYRRLEWDVWLYTPLAFAPQLAVTLMPVAFFLVVAGLTTRAPAGIHRICRHPGSTGVLLWALLHLQAVGDLRRVVLFATMAAIALFALVKNGLLHRRAAPAPAAGTPAASLLAELGWWRLALALLAYAALLALHPWLFAADPLWWLP
jgi:uncharacterized membrane protein